MITVSINQFIMLKPLLEQLTMELISCQVAFSCKDENSFSAHYDKLLDIEQKCHHISGETYSYHRQFTQKQRS